MATKPSIAGTGPRWQTSQPETSSGQRPSFPGVEGLYRGPEAVQEWADLIHSDWEEFEVSLDEVLYDGDDVVVVAELLRARGSGVELERRVFAGYWFEEGKLRKRVAFTERGAALEAARLRE